MAYTVNKLAKLSGVSVRTLHFYDEIGLLKPAYYGENNYRYYEEPQALMLQQILFYRELGFSLEDIQSIISNPDFDQVSALESHRKVLEKNIDQTKNLITTIDKTIAHLRGKHDMKIEEIFEGFDHEKQKMYEDFLVKQGVGQEVIDELSDKVKFWKKEQWMANKKEADELYEKLVSAIEADLDPASSEVQKIIKKHYHMTSQFWIPNRESYIGLSELYGSHPDFVKFYDNLHPKLLKFLAAAMKIFAERELS
jgi:DNA-binding transcriptional MerR regulator